MAAPGAVSAVVTTGIYCRDGCPGRPLSVNVRRYDLAVAAEAAGFRPCLRCRPDRRADGSTWLDAPEIVRRALRLIVDGVLDDGTEEDLARPLGVSARHLRRLFVEHVGATPDRVARSRRAHFARRLLDETDLPVVEIAFHAGFRSARQMHRVVTDVFGFSPSELRARRSRRDRSVTDGGLALRLPVAGPYAFDEHLDHLRSRAVPGVEWADATTYRTVVALHGNPAVVEIQRDPCEGHVRLVAHLPRFEPLLELVTGVRRLFGLDVPDATRTPLAGDPLLAPLVAARPGLRVPGALDRFATATRVLLGQQISVRAASRLAGELALRHGRPVAGLEALGLARLFPDAAALAAADPATLPMPQARAAAVVGFARAVDEGSVDLADPDPERARAGLLVLSGIGPWTADVIAWRVLGDPDAFAPGDLGLRKALAAGSGDLPPAGELEARSEAWRPHRALAAMHLWRSGAAVAPMLVPGSATR
jgi:AraC family transcriptional regulator, regulatory protein of adaptative response / DNA-3-methyladenine glycosylase II